MNEEEIKQIINRIWRELKQPYNKLDKSIIASWEKEWDTNLDPTNIAQFFIDRYDKPIQYIRKFIDF